MCHCRHIFFHTSHLPLFTFPNMTFVIATNCSPVGLVLFLVVSASDLVVQLAWGHGRVLEPPNRASLWRFSEFEYLEPPKNYDDNQLFCGNMTTQYELNGGKCGICGDPNNEPAPRTHEDGGENYRGIIVRGYRSGEQIPVEIDVTASHFGYFQFRLCAKDDTNSHLTQECYDENLLKLAGKQTTKYEIPVQGQPYWAKYTLQLPKGVHCKHCVLQWHYRTGNRWGNCTDGTQMMGCGDQEIFRACSDIKIYPENTDEHLIKRNPNSCRNCTKTIDFSNEDPKSVNSSTTEESSTMTSSSWQFFNQLYPVNPIHG